MPEPRQSKAQTRFSIKKNKACSIISNMQFFAINTTVTAEIMAKTLSSKQLLSLETMLRNVQDAVLEEAFKEANPSAKETA